MLDVLMLLAGLVVGGLVAWFWAGSRARAAGVAQTADLQNQLGASHSTVDELRRQLAELNAETDKLRGNLQNEQQARVTADTRLTESFKNIEEQKRLLADAEKKLKDAFSALSIEALRHNSEAFAQQAAEKVPAGEFILEHVNAEVDAIYELS